MEEKKKKTAHPHPISITIGYSWRYLLKLMGFKGRALASVKVTSEESSVPRQGTVRSWETGRGAGQGRAVDYSRRKTRGNS